MVLHILFDIGLNGQLCSFGYLFVVPFTVKESFRLRLLLLLFFLFHVEHRLVLVPLRKKHLTRHFDVRVWSSLVGHLKKGVLVYLFICIWVHCWIRGARGRF
jgi:hypothetical protein